MSGSSQGIDLSFQPTGYFRPLGVETHILATIKGADRRAIVAKFFKDGRESEIPPELLEPSLSKAHAARSAVRSEADIGELNFGSRAFYVR